MTMTPNRALRASTPLALLLPIACALTWAAGCEGETSSEPDVGPRDVGAMRDAKPADASRDATPPATPDATTGRDVTSTRRDADSTPSAPSDTARADVDDGLPSTRDGVDDRDGGASVDASSGDVHADAGGPRRGFGVLSGTCRVLDTELTDDRSHFFENRIDFGSNSYDASDRSALTSGGREILADGNAGGSSLKSEVFAYEVLARCEGATLLKTETEIDYRRPNGPKTDLLTKIDGHKIGVSVTRAFAYPPGDPYKRSQAERLLNEKLNDLRSATANVQPSDAWTKQILHVVAYDTQHAREIGAVYRSLDAETRGDAVVVVTITDGMDGFLY